MESDTKPVAPLTAATVYPPIGGRHLVVLDHAPADVPVIEPSVAASRRSAGDEMTIIVLDCSGSMGHNVGRLVQHILPKALRRLGMTDEHPVSLVAFDRSAVLYEMTVGELDASWLYAMSGTNMAPAVEIVEELLEGYQGTYVRLLTISDGEVFDIDETLELADRLAQMLQEEKYQRLQVNSQAVRYFTSSSQPDTRALCSLLQLNTGSIGTLLDLAATYAEPGYENAATEIADLIAASDSVDSAHVKPPAGCLPSLMLEPWQVAPSDYLRIKEGRNVFWALEPPAALVVETTDAEGQVEERTIPVVTETKPLNWQAYEALMRSRIMDFIQRVKVLKVLATDISEDLVERMRKYFVQVEAEFQRQQLEESENKAASKSSSGIGGKLGLRLGHLRDDIRRRTKSLIQTLLELANDEKVSQLNSAQQADYLRNVEVSKNAKGLAKRALASSTGLEFDDVVRAEARAISAHLAELDGIDGSDHTISFFSQATTVDGIRAVSELVDEGLVDGASATEIIELLNVVGVACTHRIGDYPDSISLHMDRVHFGSHVSLSDVLTAHVQSGGSQGLRVPGSDADITIAAPVFDDVRVLKFLQRHAPKTLELTSSIGMRRVLAEVPMSYGYTVLAGLWRSLEQIGAGDRSDVAVRTALRLAESVPLVIRGYFNHVDPYLDGKAEQPEGRLFNLLHNGITNMVTPLSKRISDAKFCEQTMPRVLRSLLCFEAWQAIRKSYRHVENANDVARDMLYRLLGIDLERTRLQPTPLFEADWAEPALHDEAAVDEAFLDDLMKRFYYVRFLPLLLPVLIAAAGRDGGASSLSASGEGIDKRVSALQQALPDVRAEEVQLSALGVAHSFREVALHAAVMALVYRTRAERLSDGDEDADGAGGERGESRVLIADLGPGPEAGRELVRTTVLQAHKERYETDVAAKRVAEEKALMAALVDGLVGAADEAAFVGLLRDGLKRGASPVEARVANTASSGFPELLERLLAGGAVPARLAKLRVLLLGRDSSGEDAWNRGNVLAFADLKRFAAAWSEESAAEGEFEAIRAEYAARRRHWYRSGRANRHGHTNEKPSYWALGYASLEEMKAQVSAEEFVAFYELHRSCCFEKDEQEGVVKKRRRIRKRHRF